MWAIDLAAGHVSTALGGHVTCRISYLTVCICRTYIEAVGWMHPTSLSHFYPRNTLERGAYAHTTNNMI